MNSSFVKIEDLSFAYQGNEVLKGLTLNLEQGKKYALLGPNGSGKSTLIKILSTVLTPQSGNVSVGGFKLESNNLREIRKKLGIAFQHVALDKKLTVYENLMTQASLYGLDRKLSEKKIAELSQVLKINDKKSEKVEKLSGGWQRRVDICRALLHDPSILILDEPTVGLDPISRRDLLVYLDVINRERGTTLLIATHLMEEAERSDVVIFLFGGKKMLEGNPQELCDRFLGGDLLSIETRNPDRISQGLKEKFQISAKNKGKEIFFQKKEAQHFIPTLIETFPGEIESIKMIRPNLENIFFDLTGATLQ